MALATPGEEMERAKIKSGVGVVFSDDSCQSSGTMEGPAVPIDLSAFADTDFCYLTTTGRVTGQPRTIEIWFATHQQTLYMLAGSRDGAGWVKNLKRTPEVTVRIGERRFSGRARVVSDQSEDALARRLVVGKYQSRDSDDLSDWGRTALPVAVDVTD
jgi:deazaflavin-dependent oxidoreductase (nitroreductase family)